MVLFGFRLASGRLTEALDILVGAVAAGLGNGVSRKGSTAATNAGEEKIS